MDDLKENLKLPSLKLPDYMMKFLIHLKEKNRTFNTYARYNYYLENFVAWFDKKGVSLFDIQNWLNLKDADFNAYYRYLKDVHKYKMKSLKRVSSVLMQLYLFLTDKGEKSVGSPMFNEQCIPIIKKECTLKMFVLEDDFERILKKMQSKEGLTKNQLKGRDKLINRNVVIMYLFFKYGLTLQEVVNIKMKDLRFVVENIIIVNGKKGQSREIEIELEDKKIILNYLKDIPEPVRPKWHSNHPLFVAFDYQRLTYRWVYDNHDRLNNGHPKELSMLAIQKMISQEVTRAELKGKQISAQSMRNTAIIRHMRQNDSDEEIMRYFGLKSVITLRSYKEYLDVVKL